MRKYSTQIQKYKYLKAPKIAVTWKILSSYIISELKEVHPWFYRLLGIELNALHIKGYPLVWSKKANKQTKLKIRKREKANKGSQTVWLSGQRKPLKALTGCESWGHSQTNHKKKLIILPCDSYLLGWYSAQGNHYMWNSLGDLAFTHFFSGQNFESDFPVKQLNFWMK